MGLTPQQIAEARDLIARARATMPWVGFDEIDMEYAAIAMSIDGWPAALDALEAAEKELALWQEWALGIEHEKGCASTWYRRTINNNRTGKPGKLRWLHRTYVVKEDCNCYKSSIPARGE